MSGANAQKCKLFYSEDDGTTYIQVTGVKEVMTPETSKGRNECTDLDSDAKEYLPGLSDSSAATYPVNYSGLNTSHQAMHVLDSSNAIVKWKVEFQEEGVDTATTAVYDGYVESFTAKAAVDGIQEASLKIQPSAGNTIAHTAVAEV